MDIFDRPKGATRTGQAAFATLRRALILEPVQAIENCRDVGLAESGLQPSIGVPKRTARTITCSVGANLYSYRCSNCGKLRRSGISWPTPTRKLHPYPFCCSRPAEPDLQLSTVIRYIQNQELSSSTQELQRRIRRGAETLQCAARSTIPFPSRQFRLDAAPTELTAF